MNLSHEDLSDISDLDSIGGGSDDEQSLKKTSGEISAVPKPANDLRFKLDEAKNRKLNDKQLTNPPEKTSKIEDGEEQLDFEAEDGECIEEAKHKSIDEEGVPMLDADIGEKTREEKEVINMKSA